MIKTERHKVLGTTYIWSSDVIPNIKMAEKIMIATSADKMSSQRRYLEKKNKSESTIELACIEKSLRTYSSKSRDKTIVCIAVMNG